MTPGSDEVGLDRLAGGGSRADASAGAPSDDVGGVIIPNPGPHAPRLAVRRRLEDSTHSDVVGDLLAHDRDRLVLLPIDGPAVLVRADDVVARRVVPPRAVRPASSAAAVERIAARGWPGVATYRLGGWLLRDGLGWSGRANSALVAGDPGVGLAAALDLVGAHYRAQGRTPLLQVPHAPGAPPDQAAAAIEQTLEQTGWAPFEPTHVLVADLRRLAVAPDAASPPHRAAAGRPPLQERLQERWQATPEGEWAQLVRDGEIARLDGARQVLSSAPAHYLELRLDGETVAAGRVVVTDDWCGVSCVEVRADRRRQGLGADITRRLLARGRADGARFVYLQVREPNLAAQRLYRGLGLVEHHRYHYRRLDD